MAFDSKKKSGPHDPTYKQTTDCGVIDDSFADLARVLTFVSSAHPEMKAIIKHIADTVNQAKIWVLAQ
jgi:hypothetical protein